MWRRITRAGRRAGAHNALGERGERAAADHLRAAGFTILWTNVVLPMGEVDIVARDPDGKTIVLVEVKARVPLPGMRPPEAQVNHAKRDKLRAMLAYLSKANNWTGVPRRIDVIGVDLPVQGEPVIRHHIGEVRLSAERRTARRTRR
jgi:putative endonuclease